MNLLLKGSAESVPVALSRAISKVVREKPKK